MICPYCGQTHPSSAQFCPKTGQKIPVQQLCPNCSREVQSSWKMCAFCGQKLSTDNGPTPATTKRHGKRGVGIILTCGTITLLLVGVAIVVWFLYPDTIGAMFEPLRAYPLLASPTLISMTKTVAKEEITTASDSTPNSNATTTVTPVNPTQPLVLPFGGALLGLPNLGGRTITVAVENAYPPFNNIDVGTGEAVGWDYDVVREICKRLNCVPEFKEVAWDGLFPAMNAGEYDMAADGVPYYSRA